MLSVQTTTNSISERPIVE